MTEIAVAMRDCALKVLHALGVNEFHWKKKTVWSMGERCHLSCSPVCVFIAPPRPVHDEEFQRPCHRLQR